MLDGAQLLETIGIRLESRILKRLDPCLLHYFGVINVAKYIATETQ